MESAPSAAAAAPPVHTASMPAGAALTIRLAAQAGPVGGSIEDASGVADRRIYDFGHAVKRVAAAAEAWLAVLDAADYGATWDAAATLLRNAVPRAGWERAARGTRGALGAVQQREVAGAQFTRTLPGAPDGDHVVIQYRTRFEHKAAAVETVTPMRDADGQWRVSGYFIR